MMIVRFWWAVAITFLPSMTIGNLLGGDSNWPVAGRGADRLGSDVHPAGDHAHRPETSEDPERGGSR